MSKRLSKSEIERYRAQGYCAPITVMTPDQAAEYLERLDRAVEAHPEDAAPILQMKSHLVFGCLDEMLHLPAVLDAVEDVLGPDILAWSSSMFAKTPRLRAWKILKLSNAQRRIWSYHNTRLTQPFADWD